RGDRGAATAGRGGPRRLLRSRLPAASVALRGGAADRGGRAPARGGAHALLRGTPPRARGDCVAPARAVGGGWGRLCPDPHRVADFDGTAEQSSSAADLVRGARGRGDGG